jgi:hypothetical protein
VKREHWHDPINPDDLDEVLDALLFGYQTISGPAWSAIVSAQYDVPEIEATRAKQLIFLGRYARQSIAEMEQLPLRRINELIAAASDLMSEENSLSRAQEM